MTEQNTTSISWFRSRSPPLTPHPQLCLRSWGLISASARLSTVTTPHNHTQCYTGKQVRATADHYVRLQNRLQRKGTWPPTRRRIAMQQRERRFKLSTNHSIAKHL